MAKSYKITAATKFDVPSDGLQLFPPNHQFSLPITVPGPQTKIRPSFESLSTGDFAAYAITHEYKKATPGRSLETGATFNHFIAIGPIQGYFSRSASTALLTGKKADILDFCKRTENLGPIQIKTLEVDMNALQERLPNVRGVWFRIKKGLIRAKALIGEQLQETTEFCDAKADGHISTLSFFFEDVRDGCKHPIMLTQDGTVVLQKNYKTADEEIDFVMNVKKELLEGLYTEVLPTKAQTAISADVVSD